MDAPAGGERGPVRLSSTAGHSATPSGWPRTAGAGAHDVEALRARGAPRRTRYPTLRHPRDAGRGQPAAATTSGMRNGLPQPPQTMGAWASTDGTTRTLRPQSHTALTRTPPPEDPCRAAGPRKLRAVSPAVAAVWAFSAR